MSTVSYAEIPRLADRRLLRSQDDHGVLPTIEQATPTESGASDAATAIEQATPTELLPQHEATNNNHQLQGWLCRLCLRRLWEMENQVKGMIAVYRREMGSYFVSPIAYIVVGLFLLVCGWFFYRILTFFIAQSVTAQMRAMQMGAPPAMDVPGLVIQNFFGIVSTIILFLLPMLTMGIYAEERKRGTMELLMTSPLTEFQIAFGKFLAALTLFLVMLAPTLIYQIIMSTYAEPSIPWAVLWSGYLGLVLLGSVLVALGAFISSLTESQIIAAVATFAVFLLLWVLDFGARDSSSTWSDIVQYLSILRHYDDFSRGVIDTANVIFYVSLAAVGVFLTQRSLDSMRWRRA